MRSARRLALRHGALLAAIAAALWIALNAPPATAASASTTPAESTA